MEARIENSFELLSQNYVSSLKGYNIPSKEIELYDLTIRITNKLSDIYHYMLLIEKSNFKLINVYRKS